MSVEGDKTIEGADCFDSIQSKMNILGLVEYFKEKTVSVKSAGSNKASCLL